VGSTAAAGVNRGNTTLADPIREAEVHLGTSNNTTNLRVLGSAEQAISSDVFGCGRNWPIFSLSAQPRRQFTPLNTDSTHELGSSGRGRHPLELDEAAHVVHKVHHADLHPGAHDPDGAHDLATHPVLLVGEHVLDTGTHS